MSTETTTTEPGRVTHGVDQLLNGATAWLTATDHESKGRTRAALGRAIGGGAALWFTGGLTYELGPIAWSTAGTLLALSVWVAGAPDDTEQDIEDVEDVEGDEEDQDDDADDQPEDDELLDADAFTELVHDVADGGNVHLVEIRRQLALETGREWSGPEATALCEAAGIRVRAGVRVPGATPAVTTGIHRDDLPPLPRPLPTAPVGVVAAGQHANNNTNRPTVEDIGEGAAVIIKTAPTDRQEVRR